MDSFDEALLFDLKNRERRMERSTGKRKTRRGASSAEADPLGLQLLMFSTHLFG